jgi:Bifunctional DNA primase/polymerase, N-terminal
MRRLSTPHRLRPRRLRRAALRRAAMAYAMHGWDVVPGACRVGNRFECGQPGCPTVTCHPARLDWEAAASHDPQAVRAWWRTFPYGVLLATGRTVDALEVPAALGQFVAAQTAGPVAQAPDGGWLFLVRPGHGLRPEFDNQLDLVLHGRGSWVPLPPSELRYGRMRWETTPEEYDWQLPDGYLVQAAILAGLRRHLVA